MSVPRRLKSLKNPSAATLAAPLRASSLIVSGSAYSGFILPRTAMARRFLEPMTAPKPQRPLKCFSSLVMLAYNTPFSPAGPIWATRMRSSFSSLRIASCTSPVILPHRWEASFSSYCPSWIHRYTGLGLLPVRTIASKPAKRSSGPQKPPPSLEPMVPVSGLLALTACRALPLIGAPTTAEIENTSTFSGPSGSAPAFIPLNT